MTPRLSRRRLLGGVVGGSVAFVGGGVLLGIDPTCQPFVDDCGGSGPGGGTTDQHTRTPTPSGTPVWTGGREDLPRFVTAHLLDPSAPSRVSYFRSGYGHSYTGDIESCRSMKHYFQEDPDDDTSEALFSPTDGQLVALMDERPDEGGDRDDVQVEIIPDDAPDAFSMLVHHVELGDGITENMAVSAGQQLGTSAYDRTIAEPAVRVTVPEGQTFVSYFRLMTDAVFADWQARGIESRSDVIYSRSYRNDNPIDCEETDAGDGAFQETPDEPSFVQLN